jgi:predicted nuclease with RNAse H fold
VSGQPATTGAPSPRVLLLDEDQVVDVFEVVAIDDAVVRARSAFLFELGEDLRLRIEQDGTVREVTARVRAHVGPDTDKLTELELVDQSDSRRTVIA